MEDKIQSLHLFNEKALKLERLTFIETLSQYGNGFSIRIDKSDGVNFKLTQERRGPLEEAIDAFVLTIRFFIQDNETISFRNIAYIYNSSPISDSVKAEFNSIRNHLNRYLDSNSGMAINIDGEILNHRIIMNIMIYGGLSHANREKKKRYDFWVNSPIRVLLENDFVNTMVVLFSAIKAISLLNNKVINVLSESHNTLPDLA